MVLDEQHCEIELIADLHDRFPEFVDLPVGQSRRRLVHQQEARSGGQRPGDLESLERAERQPGGRPEHQWTEAELDEQVAGEVAGAPVLGGDSDPADRLGDADVALAVGPHHHVLEQAHRREQGEVLKRPGDPEGGDAVGRHSQQVLAVVRHAARRRLVDPADDVEHRRLAGSVGTDQPADVPRLDPECQAVQGDDAAEANRHFLHVDQGHRLAPTISRNLPDRYRRVVLPPIPEAHRSSRREVVGRLLG